MSTMNSINFEKGWSGVVLRNGSTEHVYWMGDNVDQALQFIQEMRPVERAVWVARLRAMADLLERNAPADRNVAWLP